MQFINIVYCVVAATTSCSFCYAQSNKPVKASDVPQDGKPYNVIPWNGGKQLVVRSLQWLRKDAEGDRLISIGAYVHVNKNGEKKRDLAFVISVYPKEDKRYHTVAFFSLLQLKGVIQSLKDGRRILRNWRDAGVPAEDKQIDYDLEQGTRLIIQKKSGDASDYPVAIETTDALNTGLYWFDNIAEYSHFVDELNDFSKWMEAK